MKPYHGVHIYLNDGHDNFKEAWFYPIYGTSKAVARDFDNDGDEDIVLGSYFQTVGEMTKLVFKGIEVFPQLLILSNQKK